MRWAFLPALALFVAFFFAETVSAQSTAEPRKQYVTAYIDFSHTKPMRFKHYPLEQLTGEEMGWDWDKGGYHSPDDSVRINGVRFSNDTKGAGIVVYPFGSGTGASLAIKGGVETLPVIKFDIVSTAGTEPYLLTDAKSYDAAMGIRVSDRDTGWGLGSNAFILVGTGKIYEPRGKGDRKFIEAGGGVNTGPIGFDVFVKISRNRLHTPRTHYFFSVPLGLRATVSF